MQRDVFTLFLQSLLRDHIFVLYFSALGTRLSKNWSRVPRCETKAKFAKASHARLGLV